MSLVIYCQHPCTFFSSKSISLAQKMIIDHFSSPSFLWRHKFLKLLNIQKDMHLSGIIEIDETFFKYSEKGSRHLTHQETEINVRGRKKHGSIPVIVARDRQQNTFNLVMESIKVDDIYEIIKDHIDPDSIICSDSYPIYPALCKKLNLVHKKINIKQHIRIVQKVFHLFIYE